MKPVVAPSNEIRASVRLSSDRGSRHGAFLAVALLSLAALVPGAALATQADAIVHPINNAARAALPDEHAHWANAANDLGTLPRDLPLTHLALALRRSAQNQQAYENFLREQQDPASVNYHHWLTPTEIGERFGATQHDIDALSNWLRMQGLAVEAVANSHTRITFSGRASDVAAAFGTQLHYFQTGAEKRIANTAAPSIPAALQDAVQSVSGLRSIKFRPAHAMAMRSALLRSGAPQPAETHCDGSVCRHSVFPADFANIYHLNPVYGQGIDGSGQSIAIVGRARVSAADIQSFQARADLAVRAPVTIIPPGGTDPGPPATSCSATGTPSCDHPSDQVSDQFEATLDVQRAGSVAPGAAIKLIVSVDSGSHDGLQTAIEYAIDTTPVTAHILSISFLTCEADNGSAIVHSIDDLFSQAAMEGISVFVASGDSGAAGCEDQTQAPTAGQVAGTNALCSSAQVTCVGGTQFNDTANPSFYWLGSNGYAYVSATDYIPEGAWNEPTDSGATQFASTGGGVSTYIPTPPWQVGAGVPGHQGRYTPDVSLSASTHDGYFSCMAASGGACTVGTNGSFTFLVAAGTSASAPSMAGVAALLNQKIGTPQANLNPRLYALAANPANGVFHDVTVASSGVTNCTLAVPSLCNNSTPGASGLSGGLQGYSVGTGYDLATGLGSIDVTNLLSEWDNPNAASVNLDQHGLSGAWYNPQTSGQGLVIEVGRDMFGAGVGGLFAGWFTYDAGTSGAQRWYTIQGQVTAIAPTASLPIYVAEGGRFDAAQSPATQMVGTATLAFSDCSHGTLGYTFTDGRSGSMPLTRVTSNPTCTSAGDSATLPSTSALSGTYYEPATSGQGLLFDVSRAPDVLFGAWFTFAPNSSPSAGLTSQRWFTMQATPGTNAASTSNIAIYSTRGGVFDQGGGVQSTQVGTATLNFHGCSTATLAYHFTSGENSGRTGSIDLIRLLPSVVGCAY